MKWSGCYDASWKGLITPASFAHPAKFSRGLIERIFDHCLAKGYIQPGDVVGDPFGGIGTGGIVAAYRGLRWVGVELEPRFVEMAEHNFNEHDSFWKDLNKPQPKIIQGDSRRFAELVQASAVVSSPTYADSIERPSGIDPDKVKKPGGPNCQTHHQPYTSAVVSSPPYAAIAAGAGGLNTKPAKHPGQQAGRDPRAASQSGNWSKELLRYGKEDGQISRLKEGTVDACVSSPPWESNTEGVMKASKFKDPVAFAEQARKTGHGASLSAKLKAMDADDERDSYGETAGQIGKENGQTYWQAVAHVYASCFQAIKPGGVIVLVVKDYVKKRQRVPLCDDTCRLLEHIGFTPLERIQAMLTSETSHPSLFGGEHKTTKSRKSFFRRLAEKNGSPAIDFEEILIFRRPTT